MNFLWSGLPGNKTYIESGVNNPFDILVMLVYLLSVLGIGLWAIVSSSRATIEDFFLAGRNLAWWLIGASLFVSDIGPAHFMGLAGTGATSGIAVGAFQWSAPFLLFALGWIFSPIYIKAGVVTMPEYLRKRFGGYRLQFLLAVMYLFLYLFHKISVEIGTGAMFMRLILGLDVYLATMVLLAVTGIYLITGGLVAVVYTDALHAGVMVLASVLLMGFAFGEVGGYQKLMDDYLKARPSIIQDGNWTAKPECYLPRPDSFHIFRDPITGDLPWPGVIFGISILSLYYWCTDQVFVQRCLAGRNMSHVKGGCILCGYLQLLPMFSVVMPGMISRVLYTDSVACVTPSECEKHCGSRTSCYPIAYPLLIVDLLPHGVRGLMLSALWASFMSTLTSLFNSASTLFTVDIYTQIRPTATEKELMVTGRFFVIILLVVTLCWVPLIQESESEKLFEHMQAVKSYLVPPIAAIFLLAIFCKRVTEQGAFWGLTGGFLIGFFRMVSELVYGTRICSRESRCPPFICGMHYLYFATFLFVVSLLGILGISLFTDPIPDKHLHRLCWSLRNSQEERVDLDAAEGKRTALRTRPDVLKETQGCLWLAWDMFCGLEPRPSPKLAPKEATGEMKKKPGVTSRRTEHWKTPPGTKGRDTPPRTKGFDTPPGTKGHDTPPRTKGFDTPPGTKGRDTPPRTKGFDTPPGTKGRDTPPRTKGFDTPLGTKGRDTPPRTKGFDTPPGTKGHDTPPGTKGFDTPPGTKGRDTPPGTKGFDTPPGTKGPDTPPGTKGFDTPPGTKGPDTPPGTKGRDTPPGTKGPDTPPGTKGFDTPPGTKGPDTPPGTKGRDTPPRTKGPDTPPGTKGRDTPPGTKGPDTPPGTKGHDTPPGTKGFDTPTGTKGRNTPPGTERSTLKSLLWNRVIAISGVLLLLTTVLLHIIFH